MGNEYKTDRTAIIKKIMWEFGFGKKTANQLWGEFWRKYPHFAEQAEVDPALLSYCYPYFGECLNSILTAESIDDFLATLPLDTLE